MQKSRLFEESYKALNKEQQEAVDTIEGPVMVVAGPGTGKTQVLALRIATILQKTDTPASGILCLTFTNAGMRTMRERLYQYIGERGHEVQISTFHSFSISLIEKYFSLLDMDRMPTLLDDTEAVLFIDKILNDNLWSHLQPRGDATRYFQDLKSLISLLKRERISSDQFRLEIQQAIEDLKTNPESKSTRGETKGNLKKEVQKKIESLERTNEVVSFYELYEKQKKEAGYMDYDDILSYAVEIVRISEEVRANLQEEYLYILVDEHQDSSGIQNQFLEIVWGDVEKPNIFVVGDDRQLIYGFGGASLSYFENFKTTYGKAHLVSLIQNYRSTETILNLADALLKSSFSKEKLKSNREGNDSVVLAEYEYPRDEILAAGSYFKEQIKQGALPEECALILPKNRSVRSAMNILRDMGLPVNSQGSLSLFETPETAAFCRILHIIANPYDAVAISETILNPLSNIPALSAHKFLHNINKKEISVEKITNKKGSLFDDTDPVTLFGKKIVEWISESNQLDLYTLIQKVGNEILINTAKDHDELIRRVEILRTILHVVLLRREQNRNDTLQEFLEYLARIEEYGEKINMTVISGEKGVKVMTLHGSKGLEFDHVWIGHMNENVFMSGKRLGFTLPPSIEQHIVEKDEAVAKRELYVAITRARKKCIISYARYGYTGAEQELAKIIAAVPAEYFEKKDLFQTQETLLNEPTVYVRSVKPLFKVSPKDEVIELVREQYEKLKVSVTLLNNFFDCPWKWYFRNLLLLPEVKSDSLLFGSIIHESIEEILLQKEVSTKQIEEIVIKMCDKEGLMLEAKRKKFIKEAMPVLSEFSTILIPQIAKKYMSERSLSLKDPRFPQLVLYGKIDLTEYITDQKVRVSDFKTGSIKTVGVIEKRDEEGRMSSYLRQLAMYSYLIEGVEKNTQVTDSRLIFVEEDLRVKNALYSTQITKEEIDLLLKDIKDYHQALQDGSWIDRECKAVVYGKENECQYCKRARELYF